MSKSKYHLITITLANLTLGLVLFATSHQAHAESVLSLRQIDLGNDAAVVEAKPPLTTPLKSGTSLLANLPDGRQCPLMVRNSDGDRIFVDLYKCPFKNELKKGLSVEMSLAPPKKAEDEEDQGLEEDAVLTKPVPPPPPKVSAHKFLIGASYSFADRLRFEGKLKPDIGQEEDFSGRYNLDSGAAGLLLEYFYKWDDKSNWGITAGLNVDGRREVKGTELDQPTDPSLAVTDGELRSANFYFNMQYDWQPVFVYWGLNFGSLGFTESDIDLKSAFGAQLGVGVSVFDRIWLELGYRSVNAYAEVVTTSGTYEYDSIMLGGLQVNAKYLIQ